MAVLRVIISQTEEKWGVIEGAAKGAGVPSFITRELSKKFSGKISGECTEVKKSRKKKNFALKMSDDLCDLIKCQAKKSGLTPGQFISKIILDPIAS